MILIGHLKGGSGLELRVNWQGMVIKGKMKGGRRRMSG